MVTAVLRTSRYLPSKRQRRGHGLDPPGPPRHRHLLTSPSPLLPPSPVQPHQPPCMSPQGQGCWYLTAPDPAGPSPGPCPQTAVQFSSTTSQSFTPRSSSLSATFSVTGIKFQRTHGHAALTPFLLGGLTAPPAPELLKGGISSPFQTLGS